MDDFGSILYYLLAGATAIGCWWFVFANFGKSALLSKLKPTSDLERYLLITTLGYLIFLPASYVIGRLTYPLNDGLDDVESVVQFLVGIALLGFLIWLYEKNKRVSDQ